GGGPAGLHERVHVLPQDELRAPVLALRVEREAEVASGERLQGEILGRVRDAETPLAVVDREVGLAIQVVIVDEVAVHARLARLVAQLGAQLFGLLRQLEDLAQPSQLEERRPQLEADVYGLLE